MTSWISCRLLVACLLSLISIEQPFLRASPVTTSIAEEYASFLKCFSGSRGINSLKNFLGKLHAEQPEGGDEFNKNFIERLTGNLNSFSDPEKSKKAALHFKEKFGSLRVAVEECLKEIVNDLPQELVDMLELRMLVDNLDDEFASEKPYRTMRNYINNFDKSLYDDDEEAYLAAYLRFQVSFVAELVELYQKLTSCGVGWQNIFSKENRRGHCCVLCESDKDNFPEVWAIKFLDVYYDLLNLSGNPYYPVGFQKVLYKNIFGDEEFVRCLTPEKFIKANEFVPDAVEEQPESKSVESDCEDDILEFPSPERITCAFLKIKQ